MYDLIYYFPFPVIPTIFIWLILGEKRYLEYSGEVDRVDKEDQKIALSASNERLKKYAQVFLIVFLLFLPIWNLSTSETADANIRHEIFQVGSVTGVRDPVRYSLGPGYDVEKIRMKMEEDSYRWLPDELDDHVDLDELTRVPGRLGVYWLTADREHPKRYVVAYTYLAPFPVVKIFGLKIIQGEGTELALEYVGERTFVYPERPDIKSIYGTL